MKKQEERFTVDTDKTPKKLDETNGKRKLGAKKPEKEDIPNLWMFFVLVTIEKGFVKFECFGNRKFDS